MGAKRQPVGKSTTDGPAKQKPLPAIQGCGVHGQAELHRHDSQDHWQESNVWTIQLFDFRVLGKDLLAARVMGFIGANAAKGLCGDFLAHGANRGQANLK